MISLLTNEDKQQLLHEFIHSIPFVAITKRSEEFKKLIDLEVLTDSATMQAFYNDKRIKSLNFLYNFCHFLSLDEMEKYVKPIISKKHEYIYIRFLLKRAFKNQLSLEDILELYCDDIAKIHNKEDLIESFVSNIAISAKYLPRMYSKSTLEKNLDALRNFKLPEYKQLAEIYPGLNFSAKKHYLLRNALAEKRTAVAKWLISQSKELQ